MHFEEQGSRQNPTVVCVPGLFGGPTDFAAMRSLWENRLHLITLDPDRDRRKSATANIPVQEGDGTIFISTSAEIVKILDGLGKLNAFIVGVSLGSKVVFDFASKYPDRFAGGLSMDVGCGPFEDTDLYRFIDGMVDNLDLNTPFPEMKKLLQEMIPDRNLRTMIQTQLFYPEGKPPARWKAGMRHLGAVLSETMKEQGIDAQFDGMEKVDQDLFKNRKFIQILRATSISAISQESIPRLAALKCLRMRTIEGSSHFLHVTHKDLVAQTVLDMCFGRSPESSEHTLGFVP